MKDEEIKKYVEEKTLKLAEAICTNSRAILKLHEDVEKLKNTLQGKKEETLLIYQDGEKFVIPQKWLKEHDKQFRKDIEKECCEMLNRMQLIKLDEVMIAFECLIKNKPNYENYTEEDLKWSKKLFEQGIEVFHEGQEEE